MSLLFLFSCQEEDAIMPLYQPALMELPAHFPSIEFPPENAFSYSRWKLGKALFYDPILSRDSTLSCASCHLQEAAFSDVKALSIGVDDRMGTRNTPSLANVAYHPYFTKQGGVSTLEKQILIPIQEHNEFDFNIVLISERLNQSPSYISQSMEAYDRIPDHFVITRAIATFERSLLSANSLYDQYYYEGQEDLFSESQIRGMDLFFSERTNCSNCHSGVHLTSFEFENNGLYEEYEDIGRFRITQDSIDLAKFKIPSLRNVALTAPYMHDGSMETLKEVVSHYTNGGKNHPNKNAAIRPLNLTATEQDDLIQFLHALTDESFVNNQLFAK